MIEVLITVLLFNTFSLLLGFALGCQWLNYRRAKIAAGSIIKLVKPKGRVGAVVNPNAAVIAKRADPIKTAGEDAMREVIEKHILPNQNGLSLIELLIIIAILMGALGLVVGAVASWR